MDKSKKLREVLTLHPVQHSQLMSIANTNVDSQITVLNSVLICKASQVEAPKKHTDPVSNRTQATTIVTFSFAIETIAKMCPKNLSHVKLGLEVGW